MPETAATLMPESNLAASSFGKQSHSAKPTAPSHGFGTAIREAGAKVFISPRHEKKKVQLVGPGPVYNVQSTFGESAKWSFNCDEQRKHPKAKYPDSSVDVNGATVDSQRVKFHGTKGVHFGTEVKGSTQNAEIVRVNPSLTLGMASPGSLEYESLQAEQKNAKKNPEYSFAPPPPSKTVKGEDGKEVKKKDKDAPIKVTPRCHVPNTGTPRTLGPGSHNLDSSFEQQPRSARKTAPSFSFNLASPKNIKEDQSGNVLDLSPKLSSMGAQLASKHPTMPRATFGESTRHGVRRQQLVMHDLDRGPCANLPKPNHHCEMPKPMVRVAVGPGL